MTGGRLVFLLLWMYLQVCIGGEWRQNRDIPPDKIHLQKSQPYNNEEPGFFSRIASWFFPFGGSSSASTDSVPSSGHQSRPHYLPLPKISTNIKYLPAAHNKINQYPHVAPSSESSDCNPCNREPWIPIGGKSGKNTIIQFIPPQNNIDFILDGLNPPPLLEAHVSPVTEYYGPPPISVPSGYYDNPPSKFSSPFSNQYRPFEESKINSQHTSTTHILPQYESSSLHGQPHTILHPYQHEQAKHKLHPSVQYELANSNPQNSAYNSPPPSILPKPPTFLNGPPAPVFRSKPSTNAYTNFGVSNTQYGIKDHMVPPAIQTSPLKNYQDIIGMKAPPVANNYPNTQLNPLKQHTNNPHNIQDILQPPVSQYPILAEDFPPNTKNPLASHGSPNIHGIEQVPLSSGDNDDLSYPIAFPNLSIKPLAPIHNFINFKQRTREAERVESIQILPSVTLGDYISSIEYPINVIQSPLVEVNLNKESEITKLIKISNQSATDRSVYYSPTPNTIIQSGLFVNPSINTGKFNEEPIVVDDAHAAASSHNDTYKEVDYTSKKEESGEHKNETFELQTAPLNGRENVDDDSTIIENGISHSSDIIIPNNENAFLSQTSNEKAILERQNVSTQFTQPPMDYSQWTPTWSGLSMEISPPPLHSAWLAPKSSTEVPPKKTKHVQIIIPYYNFNKTIHPFNNIWNSKEKKKPVIPFRSIYETDSYTTLLPVYKPPSSSDRSVWSDFINDLSVTPFERIPASAFKLQSTTQVYNIQDILGFPSENHVSQKLPFDILSLQKNINEWTQQAFSKTTEKLTSSRGVLQKLSPSKNIPQEYFTTVPYDYTTIKPLSHLLSDHETAGSVRSENYKDDIGNNLVLDYQTSTSEQTTTLPSNIEQNTTENETQPSTFTTKDQKSLWNNLQTTFSPVTQEKVYIVTPAPSKITTNIPIVWSLPPRVGNGSALVDKTLLFEHPKFSIRIEDNTTISKGNGSSTTKVIYSEWPHKINNLQTATVKPTSRHPLFGLMDISAYTAPYTENLDTLKVQPNILQVTTSQRIPAEKAQEQKQSTIG